LGRPSGSDDAALDPDSSDFKTKGHHPTAGDGPSAFQAQTDNKETNMKTSTQPDKPEKRPQPGPERGTPTSSPAHAVRKDVAVRVTVSATPPESDELPEHGYGHGV
jgi:hypothetical protein